MWQTIGEVTLGTAFVIGIVLVVIGQVLRLRRRKATVRRVRAVEGAERTELLEYLWLSYFAKNEYGTSESLRTWAGECFRIAWSDEHFKEQFRRGWITHLASQEDRYILTDAGWVVYDQYDRHCEEEFIREALYSPLPSFLRYLYECRVLNRSAIDFNHDVSQGTQDFRRIDEFRCQLTPRKRALLAAYRALGLVKRPPGRKLSIKRGWVAVSSDGTVDHLTIAGLDFMHRLMGRQPFGQESDGEENRF